MVCLFALCVCVYPHIQLCVFMYMQSVCVCVHVHACMCVWWGAYWVPVEESVSSSFFLDEHLNNNKSRWKGRGNHRHARMHAHRHAFKLTLTLTHTVRKQLPEMKDTLLEQRQQMPENKEPWLVASDVGTLQNFQHVSRNHWCSAQQSVCTQPLARWVPILKKDTTESKLAGHSQIYGLLCVRGGEPSGSVDHFFGPLIFFNSFHSNFKNFINSITRMHLYVMISPFILLLCCHPRSFSVFVLRTLTC